MYLLQYITEFIFYLWFVIIYFNILFIYYKIIINIREAHVDILKFSYYLNIF